MDAHGLGLQLDAQQCPTGDCSDCKVPVLCSLLALPKERKFGWKFWPGGQFGLRGLQAPGKACIRMDESVPEGDGLCRSFAFRVNAPQF